jgi:hypothetical protein
LNPNEGQPSISAEKKENKVKNETIKSNINDAPNLLNQKEIAITKRQLETEAYSAVLTAFRIQGDLTWKKETILSDLRGILKISDDSHRREVEKIDQAVSKQFGLK